MVSSFFLLLGFNYYIAAASMPLVSPRIYAKQFNLGLTPKIGAGLFNAFTENYVVELEAVFCPYSEWGLFVSSQYFWSQSHRFIFTGAKLPSPVTTTMPQWDVQGGLHISPFYGKMQFLQAPTVHFEPFAQVGGGIMTTQNAQQSWVVYFAGGQTLFANRHLALHGGLQTRIFRTALIPNGKKNLQWNSLWVLGLSFFIPRLGWYSLSD